MTEQDQPSTICLASPPTITDLEDKDLAESDAVRLIAEHAPIGILTLAAVLEQHGFASRIIDLNSVFYEYLRCNLKESDFCTFAVNKITQCESPIFGLGTICSTYPLTLRIAQEIKRVRPDSRIVLGGPQASVVDVQTLEAYDFIDFVVRGEAEETLPALMAGLQHARVWETLPGLTFRRHETVVRNPNASVILDLDALPMPAFHLYPQLNRSRYVPLELGRGCPFACKFCSTNDFFRRRFRLKSPYRVMTQMRWIKQTYGIDRFELIHDMFTVDRKRVVEFCQAVLASGEHFNWNCSARTDCVDEELIALMAAAGCRSIFFGIETGSARLQKQIDKNLDLTEAMSMIRSTNHHHIATTVSLITGFPDEKLEDLRSTVHFLMDAVTLDYAQPQLHLLAPLAETPIHSQYRDSLILDDIFSDHAYQGWRQDPVERAMIARHPEIFSNFYGLPTNWLDRVYIKELRDFILHGIERFKWLLVALHQDSGDLLGVFDCWRNWRRSGIEPSLYYSCIEFREEFLEFVRSAYIPAMAKATDALSALLECESADRPMCECAAGNSSDTPSIPDRTTIPKRMQGVRILQLQTDYKEIIQCLKQQGDLSRVPTRPVVAVIRAVSNRKSDVLQLSPASARLLLVCDGKLSVSDIAGQFSLPEEACIFGLENLHQHGLVTFELRTPNEDDPTSALSPSALPTS
jgi:radical SAM superfamily enzyme YgiQ (UPF0313 family)